MKQMTLSELIDDLARLDAEKPVHFGFGTGGPTDLLPAFKGDEDQSPAIMQYDQVAFALVTNTTVGSMLLEAKLAIGLNDQGWRRGRYPVNGDTPTCLATNDRGRIPLTDALLTAMIRNRLWKD